MHILALDLSGSSTGWARWWPGRLLPLSGAERLCDGQGQYAAACVAIHNFVHQIHSAEPIDIIVREEPILLPTDTLAGLMLNIGLASHVESYAKIKRIPCEAVAIRTWRKTFIPELPKKAGRPAAKRMAMERARQLGMDPLTDDEAEASALLDHKLHVLGIAPPWRLANPFLQPL